MTNGEKGSGRMKTFWFLMDWATLLYFCLSSLVFGISILFFSSKYPRIFTFSTINWTVSNLVKAIWNFAEDSLLFENKESNIPALIQLIISVVLIPVTWYFLALLKKAAETQEENQTVPIQVYTNDSSQNQPSQDYSAIEIVDIAVNEENKKQ